MDSMNSVRRESFSGGVSSGPAAFEAVSISRKDHLSSLTAKLSSLILDVLVASKESALPMDAKASFDPEKQKLDLSPTAAEAAQQLVAALNPPELDLLAVKNPLLSFVDQLPDNVWSTLHEFARDSKQSPLTSVAIPISKEVLREPAKLEALCVGLRGLPTLQHLTLDPAELTDLKLDLGGLGASLERIDIRIDQISDVSLRIDLDVTVRLPVKVGVTHDNRASLGKSVVRYVDEARKPLAGGEVTLDKMYFRRPTDHLLGSDAKSVSKAYAESLKNNNGKANYDDPLGGPARKDSKVVCRHLSAHYFKQREAYHKARAAYESQAGDAKAPPRFSFDRFKTTDNIESIIDSQFDEEEIHLLNRQGACALFDADHFGAALGSESSGMATGGVRYLALTTDNHVMAVELQVKERVHGNEKRKEYVVALFDPNATTTHIRRVVNDPRQFARQSLNEWLGPGYAEHYSNATPPMAAFFEWKPSLAAMARHAKHPPPPSQLSSSSPAKHHVSEETRMSPRFAEWVLVGGQAGKESKVISAALSSPLSAETIARLGAGFVEALSHGLPGAGDYLRAILSAPGLSEQERFQLLSAVPARDPDAHHEREKESGVAGQAFRFALTNGEIDAVTTYARAVANAPADALTGEHREQLLLASTSLPGRYEWDATVRPTLFKMCGAEKLPHSHPNLIPRRHEAIYSFISEVAASQALDTAAKIRICQSSHNRQTAAEYALANRDPCAAAAMICAVLEKTTSEQSPKALLDSLGKGIIEKTVAGLTREGVIGHPKEWRGHLLAAIDSAANLGRLTNEESAELHSQVASAERLSTPHHLAGKRVEMEDGSASDICQQISLTALRAVAVAVDSKKQGANELLLCVGSESVWPPQLGIKHYASGDDLGRTGITAAELDRLREQHPQATFYLIPANELREPEPGKRRKVELKP